ncbi:MAG: nicotinate (nicotinamide) nucleotide adenylyltransferase [Chloroflexi bacterium]|nr:nicotinate (nicotinamide) nucleotide adenylyltransferase [Chloroflexota bacterium]
MSRIGMLGGTFDPPHNAHLALAEAARATLHLDRVVVVPAGDPWRKRDREVTPAAARVEMVRAAVSADPWISVSTIEVDRDGASYTAETLAALVQPDEQWWCILGADALADMPYWSEPNRILELARLAVARRPDSTGPLLTPEVRTTLPQIESRIDFIQMPQLDISATEIRRRIAAGESTDDLLPHPVREVIDRLALYR